MRINIYFPQLELGGVQTFMSRLSRLLEGVAETTVVFRDRGDAYELLQRHARMLQVDRNGDWAIRIFEGGPSLHLFLNHSCILWWSSHRHLIRADDSILAYALGPSDFCGPSGVGAIYPRLMAASSDFFGRLPSRALLFMNDYYRHYCGPVNDGSGRGITLPLAVDLRPGVSVDRRPCDGEILSIGRLVGMKRYHIGVFRFLANQRARGKSAYYRVIGAGPARGLIEREAIACGVRDLVEFVGAVAYEDMHRYLETPAVFVGMGTSAVEAASAGVPVVLANMFDDNGLSPGLLASMPGFQIGDDPRLPSRNIEDCIEEVLSLSEFDYRSLCRLHVEHVQRFEERMILEGFLSICKEAPRFEASKVPNRVSGVCTAWWGRAREFGRRAFG